MNETTSADTQTIVAYVVIGYITGLFLVVLACVFIYTNMTTHFHPVTPTHSITITPPTGNSPNGDSPSAIFSPSRSIRSDVTNLIHIQSNLMSGSDFLLPEAANENVRRLTL